MTDNESDEFLMTRARWGSQACMEQLVRRHADLIYAFLFRHLRHHAQAEELFQEVFLAVWKNRLQYDPDKPFKPWLFAIALNKVREQVRPRSFRLTDEYELPDPPAPPDASNPECQAVATERQTIVENAVSQLPPRQKRVLTMRIWDGLSYAEIAKLTHGRESGIRSIMRDALANLRSYFELHRPS